MSSASQEPRVADPKSAPDWHRLGNELIDQGKIDRAITAYRRALRIDAKLAEVHNDLGTAYFEKKWLEQAEQSFRTAIRLRPDHHVAHANLGAVLRAQGRLPEGRRAFQRALALKIRAALPPFLRWKLGDTGESAKLYEEIVALINAGNPAAAKTLALRAEKRFPDDPEIAHAAATALGELGEISAALERIDRALRIQPERAAYHVRRSGLLLWHGNPALGVEAAATAVRLAPELAPAHVALSAARRRAGDFQGSEQAARRALELDPELAVAHDCLAMALAPQERTDEALAAARDAVRLDPGIAVFRLNLATALFEAGRMDEARALYRAMAGDDFVHPDMRLNMGSLALHCEADPDAARRWYGDSRERELRVASAVADLLQHRYDSAWPKFEARKQTTGHASLHTVFSGIRQWDGQALGKERLLVYSEQGIGDQILFASMLPDALRRAPGITFLCDARLTRLAARSFPTIEVLPAGEWTREDDQRYGFAIAAGSLPLHFRRRAEDFPPHRGFLAPDPARVRHWQGELAQLGAGRKIGLSWRGGILKTGRHRRSIALEELRPLLDCAGTTWVSLQHGDDGTGGTLHRFPGVTQDIDELAALIQALDLVVTVCNTTVHVAGALGKEALVMAPVVPLWMYGLEGERMPWYPSARIFRQARYGDWAEVISRVSAEVRRTS